MTGAVIWDLDGTLVDSAEYHWRAWKETMEAEGISITHEQFLATFGERNDSILKRWLGEWATPEVIERIGDAKEACYRRLVRVGGLSPLPGVRRWIEHLDAQGWRQAIASSAPRLNIAVVLEALGFNRYFQAVVSAEDVRRGKPDPEVFLTAASRLDVPPRYCIVVEDAEVGIEAARRAGMKSIGVNSRTQLTADIVVSSLAELAADVFEKLLRGAV